MPKLKGIKGFNYKKLAKAYNAIPGSIYQDNPETLLAELERLGYSQALECLDQLGEESTPKSKYEKLFGYLTNVEQMAEQIGAKEGEEYRAALDIFESTVDFDNSIAALEATQPDGYFSFKNPTRRY